jgi:hypothetical protein
MSDEGFKIHTFPKIVGTAGSGPSTTTATGCIPPVVDWTGVPGNGSNYNGYNMNMGGSFVFSNSEENLKSARKLQNPRVENRRLACELFPSRVVEKKVKSSFATAEQKSALTGLKVIFGNENYWVGQTVYVEAESFASSWGKRVYTLDGKDFILVPEEAILMVKNA